MRNGWADTLVVLFLMLSIPVFAGGFTYDDLVQMVRAKHLRSIEDVLPRLPEELRANYTLMHASRSLQKATYESPRAILFGNDARLTCAFDGDGDSLECFQFIESARLFDFRQIQFPTRENGLREPVFSKSNQTVDGKVSCTKCHGADPRPNWDHYSIWPGAYGGDDDDLDSDLAHYDDFVARRASHPRYRWLIQGSGTREPYMDFKAGVTDIGHRPNLRFSEACGRLDARRAERLLESKTKRWETLGFALRALQCALTPEQRARIEKAGRDFERDTNLSRLFGLLDVSATAWSTQIFGDPITDPVRPWEHQSGFGYLSLDVAMAVVERWARDGDSALREGLEKIRRYYDGRYTGGELEFRRVLNAIVLDPDVFGGHLSENVDSVCPRLAELFVSEYLRPPRTGASGTHESSARRSL